MNDMQLVKYLSDQGKLKFVMSPYVKTCSSLLKKSAKENIVFMDNLKGKLEYVGRTATTIEKAPPQDGT